MTYDANDHVTCITDGTTRIDETLSPSGRVLRRRVSSGSTCTGAPSSPTEDLTFGFASNGDSPAWSKPTAGGSVTTYLGGPGGLQIIDTAGTPIYPIHSPHGDIIGTTNAAGTFTAAPATDEFGVGLAATNRLGWLGGANRFISHEGLDLFRMGVRVYDPRLGRFLQVDPVEGGSCNDYDYVCGDPVGGLDLGGTKASPEWITQFLKERVGKFTLRQIQKLGSHILGVYWTSTATNLGTTLEAVVIGLDWTTKIKNCYIEGEACVGSHREVYMRQRLAHDFIRALLRKEDRSNFEFLWDATVQFTSDPDEPVRFGGD